MSGCAGPLKLARQMRARGFADTASWAIRRLSAGPLDSQLLVGDLSDSSRCASLPWDPCNSGAAIKVGSVCSPPNSGSGRSDHGAYAGQVFGLRDRMNHGHRLHLRGNATHMSALLAAVDGFVLDSFLEGWSLSSMEVLAAALPVVMCDVGGAHEQMTGGPKKGVLISNPLGDPIAVDWTKIGLARFRGQANRDELVDGMSAMARSTMILDDREAIAMDSLARVDDELCVRRHSRVIWAASKRNALALPAELDV